MTPLSFCVMPSRVLRRDVPGGFRDWSAEAQAAFDSETLFYDAFEGAEPGTVYAVGPPLKRRFRIFVKQAEFLVDGQPAQMREISQSQRASILEITSNVAAPTQLSIRHPDLSLDMAVSPSQIGRYQGLKTLFTLSRNNDLAWVRDWARHHVETQGVEAIILFDNASDRYGTDALEQVLSNVPGLTTFDVVPAPFRYGPAGDGRELTSARFLQFGLFEIARLRFLAQAAGVLNMDIDEMAYGPAGETVFQAAADSEAGFLTLPGTWRYPQPGAPLTHAAHLLRSAEEDAPMYPKWCLIPNGPQLGKSWRTHGIKGLPDQLQQDFGFFHCRMISQSWHYDRSEYQDLTLEPDPLARRILQRGVTAQAAETPRKVARPKAA
ncbi:hypothetical protein SAMN05421666_0003 [Roseovarius nanhaiticus]|uniref:Glycosyltransferase family 2 protein n=1 Tax=Roseovarius nanhaiticus TaxID=573024 RepID=A0A1N7E674_9RHOB|nr:hypothetical protein [Roseovarius nanhaiticus]SEK80618.1 hypothetical protein SAMN05216208_2131 [Roseovarius nanhaiticus]SIR83643.1 hypothetical protein SAMN05421666_0003 [Roseovarius nanhaiticus]